MWRVALQRYRSQNSENRLAEKIPAPYDAGSFDAQLMTTSDWAFYCTMQAVKWLEPILYAVGLVIAVRTFRRCRKPGYIVLVTYFALCLFLLLAMPPINRAIRARRTPDISEQTQKKIDEAVRQAVDRVMQEEGHPRVVGKERVNFPFGPLLLVAGVWMLAKREKAEPCAEGKAA